MKERILNALKAKFTGVSADILDRIAAMLAKTVTTEEQVATAVEGVTEELISVIEGFWMILSISTSHLCLQTGAILLLMHPRMNYYYFGTFSLSQMSRVNDFGKQTEDSSDIA